MSYIEIKTINGRQYRYERVSTRHGTRVSHTSRYLGPVHAKTTRCPGAGRKPRLKVRDLKDEERMQLVRLLHSNKSFEKDRARILSLSSKGQSVRSITGRTGFHRPKRRIPQSRKYFVMKMSQKNVSSKDSLTE